MARAARTRTPARPIPPSTSSSSPTISLTPLKQLTTAPTLLAWRKRPGAPHCSKRPTALFCSRARTPPRLSGPARARVYSRSPLTRASLRKRPHLCPRAPHTPTDRILGSRPKYPRRSLPTVWPAHVPPRLPYTRTDGPAAAVTLNLLAQLTAPRALPALALEPWHPLLAPRSQAPAFAPKRSSVSSPPLTARLLGAPLPPHLLAARQPVRA
jgi:hypothetical protein